MKVEFRESFLKDLRRISDKPLLSKVKAAIENAEQAETLQAIIKLKKIKGSKGYFRIKLSDYRIGLKLENDTVNFVRFLHRKEIYRFFP